MVKFSCLRHATNNEPRVTVWPHIVRRSEATAARVLKLSKMFWLVYVRASRTEECNFYFILIATFF